MTTATAISTVTMVHAVIASYATACAGSAVIWPVVHISAFSAAAVKITTVAAMTGTVVVAIKAVVATVDAAGITIAAAIADMMIIVMPILTACNPGGTAITGTSVVATVKAVTHTKV